MAKRTPQAAPVLPPTKAQQLALDAAEAAQLRAYQVHPDVVALRVERIRTWCGRLMWTGIVLGLAFTMATVQVFAAQGHERGSLPWLSAWLLDPMVSLILIGILIGESVTSRYQIDSGGWVRAAKWAALGATYAMNTWSAWKVGDAAAILLHSVPPGMVFVAVEAMPQLRDRLTEAVTRASIEATRSRRSTPAGSTPTDSIDRPAESIGSTPTDSIDRPAESIGSTPTGPTIEPIDRVAQPTDRPRSTRSDRPRSTPIEPTGSTLDRAGDVQESTPIESAGSTAERRRSRSIEELRIEVAKAIGSGRLDPEPSAESIRRELKIGPARARELRDELTQSTPIDRPVLRAVDSIDQTHEETAAAV